jgi:hypothetical protein
VSPVRSTTGGWIPIAAIGIRGIIWATTASDVPPIAIVKIVIAIIVYAGLPECLVHVDKDVRCEVKMCHIEAIIKYGNNRTRVAQSKFTPCQVRIDIGVPHATILTCIIQRPLIIKKFIV